MHFLGILRGIGLILFIVSLAGAIAYIGDRVGHQIGRKRLTLFNIRPRYTSTIIAVGTGMLIALVITLIAIFASNQVQIAFFRLNEIDNEIQTAQARANELEEKVTNSPVVVNLDSIMVPFFRRIPANYPTGLRSEIVQDFYNQTVAYVNRTYTRPGYGLKKFEPPKNLPQMLDALANGPKMQAFNSENDVLLLATASQNLYRGDQIHFQINATPDHLLVGSGRPIAGLIIPAGKNVSADLAVAELLSSYVPREMLRRGMVPNFAANVIPQKSFPALPEMQRSLSGAGTYVLTAFAATDIYQHTFSVPVVVALQKVPQ